MKNKINSTEAVQSTSDSQNSAYYDFMALLFFCCYLVIDFLPDFKSIEIIGTQFFYLAVLNCVIAIYLFKNPLLLSQNLFGGLKKDWIFRSYVVFLFFCGITLFIANNISISIVSFVDLLVVLSMFLNLYALFYKRLYLVYKLCFIIAISVFLQTSLEFFQLIKHAKTSNIFNAISNLKANTGNINVYAASLSIKIPFILIGLTHYSKFKKVFFALSLFLATLTIFFISARAAYISMFFIIVAFVIFHIKSIKINKPSIITILYVAIPLVLAFIITNTVFSTNKGTDRFESVGNRVTQIINTKEASNNARLTYWKTALTIIQKNPVMGVGIGNWKLESLPYESKYIDDALSSSHTHNDFLEITTETGVFNGLVYLFLFGLLVLTNLKKVLKKEESNTKTIALLTLLMVISYGIDAFFNFPLYRSTMQFSFAILLAFTLLNHPEQVIEEQTEESNSNKKSILPLGLIALAAITIYFTFVILRAYQLEYKIKYSTVTSTEIAERMPKFPNVGIYAESFPEYLAIAYFKENDYIKATQYFNVAKSINPYLGVPDWYLHRIEKSKGNIDDAYKYAKIAFYTRPRNSNYFLDAINMASKKKDTVEILKIHNLFSSYRNMASNWKNSSSALYNSNYKIKNIIQFVDKGLLSFPKDTSLLERKKILTERLTGVKNSDNILPEDPAVAPSTEKNYMVDAKKMGDQNQFEKAIELYKKAFEQSPEKRVILQDIGVCYYKLNKPDSAIKYLKQTLGDANLEPGKTEYLLAGCYFNLKDKENGCKYLTIASDKKFPNTEPLLNQLCK